AAHRGHSFGARCRSRLTEISAYQAVAPSRKTTGARPRQQATAGCPWPTGTERTGGWVEQASGKSLWQGWMRVNRAQLIPPADRATALRAARPTCHLPPSLGISGLASSPACASNLCRWLPVAVCPNSLTAGWYRGGVAPVGVDQPQGPGGGGDPGVDNAAVGVKWAWVARLLEVVEFVSCRSPVPSGRTVNRL